MNYYLDAGYTSFQKEEREQKLKKELSEEEYQRRKLVEDAELARENDYNFNASTKWNYYYEQKEQHHHQNYDHNFTSSSNKTLNNIKKTANNRNIQRLVHFTKIENLRSILKHGLLSRKELSNKNLKFKYNDEQRLDNQLDAICLSITFPNYGFFCKSRNSSSNNNWVVLELKPDLLWKKECVFCIDNAANSKIKINRKQSLAEKNKFFNLMFKKEYNGLTRKILDIPNNYTTAPQAEVLCFDAISSNYINKIAFYNKTTKNKLEILNADLIKQNNISLYVNKNLFRARQDYKSWQSKKRDYNG